MSALRYNSNLKKYSIAEFYKGRIQPVVNRIDYCPWCGSKLPDLTDVWEQLLIDEYHIEEPWSTDENDLPAEFNTDEWWKKRGL